MKQNFTIDNISPLISYLPATAWVPGLHTDVFWTEYSEGTFTLSATRGANATFTFYGTGIWLFGALRENHGMYNVTLDGVPSRFNGFAPANATLFQHTLFSATDLAPGTHVVQLINDANTTTLPYLDLDFITWETEIGAETDVVTDTTQQDNDAAFQYGPAVTAWSTAVDNLGLYSGGNGHTTVSTAGFVTYTFTGSAVSIYGAVGPLQGPYTVQLDGGAAQNFTAANLEFHPQSLLYRADGIGEGQHVVRLANAPLTAGQSLSIDYAVFTSAQAAVSSTPSSSSTASSSTYTGPTTFPDPEPTGDGKKSAPAGLIVGVIMGVLALFAIVGFVLMILKRRLDKKEKEEEPDMLVVPAPYTGGIAGRYIPPSMAMNEGYDALNSSTGHTPLYPPSRAGYEQYGMPIGPNGSTPSLYAMASPPNMARHQSFGVNDSTHSLRHYPPTTEGSYGATGSEPAPRSPFEQSSNGYYNASPLIPGATTAAAATVPQNGTIPPRKGAAAPLPPSATAEQQIAFQGIDEQELSQRRMNVEGRAQDFGPVLSVNGPGVTLEDRPLPELPPNYTQATETLQR